MTQTFPIFPTGDVENDGWTLVASSYTRICDILAAFQDDCHIRCPSYRGGAEVSFPVDVTSLPLGAIIDSVTIFVRLKSNAGSGPRCVTINVLSTDNRSRYTTRTIYASSDIQTKEVATYTKDPLGKAWDVSRLNKLRLRMFSYNNLFDSVRLYGLEVRVNYHTPPTVTVDAPTGTVTTPSPVISWHYLQAEGEPQKSAEYKIFSLSDASAATFDPSTAPAVFDTVVNGIANSYTIPTALNSNDYKVFVRVTSQAGCVSPWASRQFTVNAPSPGVPGDNNAGIAGIPGIGVPTVVPDNYTSSAAIRMTDTSNLLSVQQADFEIPSDPLGYTPANCVISRDTTTSFGNGFASLKMVASSAATMQAVSSYLEIMPGQPFTVRAQAQAAATARTVNARVRFFDDQYVEVPSSAVAATGTDGTGGFTEVVATGVVPATMKYATVTLEVVSPANAEVHNWDHVGLMYGANTAWSDGGHTSRNLLTSFLATGDDPVSLTDAWSPANAATTNQIVSATGTGADGLKCNQMSYVGVAASIAFRATGAVFTTPTTGTDFTLNKPAGVQDNDLLLAFVTSTESGTITPPVGWTTVNTASIDDGTTDTALWVLKRSGLASDPSTWATGVTSVASSRRTAVVVAYSGCANADSQFIADAVRTDSAGTAVHQTAQVANTDPNAWRVCAFAASESAAGGSFIANTSAPSVPPPIAYVGKATAWITQADNTGFTINKPAGVVSGDLMLATLAMSGSVVTVNLPSGWTLVRKVTTGGGDPHSGDMTAVIMKRTAGASEPNSWTGSIAGADWGQPKITQAVAYRNCDIASNQFIAENSKTYSDTSTLVTQTINNTNSKAWRVCMFAGAAPYGNAWTGGDVSERTDDTTNLSNFVDASISWSDSNGQVATGNQSRTGKVDNDSVYTGVSWIAMLKPLTSAPSPGANETERVDNDNGSSNPWLSTAVYDSNAVVPTGTTSVYGQMSGSTANSMASWIGILKPAASQQGGLVATHPNNYIDIGNVDDRALTLAGGKVTIMANFQGSSAGTPSLALEFYRANQFISSVAVVGNAFDTTSWTKSWGVFDIPEGTTRMRPVVSAFGRSIGDTVRWDRTAVMLGALPDATTEPFWENGTARAEHPVWSIPVIQYQENGGAGYGDWKVLPGQITRPPLYDQLTNEMFYVDHTIVPLNSRRYRVATLSFGLNGDIFSSGYGPESAEAIFEPNGWWLKDIFDLSNNMQISVKADDQDFATANTAAAFQPLGSDYPIVVTDGFKSDNFEISIHCEQTEYPQLLALLKSGRTLILQSDIDKMWWVRPVGDATATVLNTGSRTDRPRRYVKIAFAEVAPEQ